MLEDSGLNKKYWGETVMAAMLPILVIEPHAIFDVGASTQAEKL